MINYPGGGGGRGATKCEGGAESKFYPYTKGGGGGKGLMGAGKVF